VRFNERFRIAGELVSDEMLQDALEECERANGNTPITVFEMETAAGFLLFSRNPADVLLLEVGLGGQLDATNVIDKPLASVITPVSMDHLECLGDTIEKIAAEKAGILKRGVPAVIAPQNPAALAVIERQAQKLRAPLKTAGEHWNVHSERGRLVYQDDDGLLDLPAPRLYGRHQAVNAGVAIAALRGAGFRLPPAAYEAGLVKADWPARMQRLRQGKLGVLVPPDGELWLDGGHNPDGGRAIAAALADLEDRVPRPLIIVAGMLATKDHANFFRHFSGLASRLYAIPIPHQEKTLPPAEIVKTAQAIGIPAEAADNIEDALAKIRALSLTPAPRILIAGSLYLAGEILKENGTLPD
jgi:dihydrofolate synthase/folylpolyglutamate synthase